MMFGMLFLLAIQGVALRGVQHDVAQHIDFLTKNFHDSLLKMSKHGSVDYQEALGNYHYALGMIVLGAQDMTKQAKLQHLIGMDFVKERKAIITSMIEDDGVDPNAIRLHSPEISPLFNALLEDDVTFAIYLMHNNAVPDDDLKRRLDGLRQSDNLVAQLLIVHHMNDARKGE